MDNWEFGVIAIVCAIVAVILLGFFVNVGSPIATQNFVTTHEEYACSLKWYAWCWVK